MQKPTSDMLKQQQIGIIPMSTLAKSNNMSNRQNRIILFYCILQ